MSEISKGLWSNLIRWLLRGAGTLVAGVVITIVAPPLAALLMQGCGGPSESTSSPDVNDLTGHAKDAPLTPEEAAKRVGQDCTVEMRVAHTHITDYYLMLNSKKYKEAGDFIIRIKKSVLPEIKEIGAGDPERYFFGKTIIVSGTVTRYEEQGVITVINQDQIKKIRK